MNYFVVMIDFGRRGLQAVVEPELTRSNVIDRVASGEYPRDDIAFIHFIHDGVCEVVTEEILEAAGVEQIECEPVDHQSARWDRARDLAKHGESV